MAPLARYRVWTRLETCTAEQSLRVASTRGRFFHARPGLRSTGARPLRARIYYTELACGDAISQERRPRVYFAVDAVNKNMTRVLVKKLLPPWKGGGERGEGGGLIRGLYSFHAPPFPSMEINFPFNALLFCPRADNRVSIKDRPVKNQPSFVGLGLTGLLTFWSAYFSGWFSEPSNCK